MIVMAPPSGHGKGIPPRLETPSLAREHHSRLAPSICKLAASFGIRMQAATGKWFGEVMPVRVRSDAEPVFVIHAEVQRFVEAAALFKHPPPPPDGRLTEKIATMEAGGRKRAGALETLAAGIALQKKKIGVNDIDVGFFLKSGEDFGESAGFIEIVGAEVGKNVARGYGEAFVDRVGLPPVGFGNPTDIGALAE